ncbi:MAG: hypothetical protein OXF79_00865 [Chloroflexi bacterium]|nr:hypothetical protein [Chloroflexota bacterium]
MQRELAENLLARIMDWDDATKAEERVRLERFAAYKYDQYQKFSPGRRYLESLALWLRQFKKGDERRIAYNFVRDRLVFISNEEMNSLVDLAFPTVVRPALLRDAATASEISGYRSKAIQASQPYRALTRQTLILGLSDGARTDRFRRVNAPAISHEQVFHAYDVSQRKADDMVERLHDDLADIMKCEPNSEEARFRYVVLLDDFSASGFSYIRQDSLSGLWQGKIPKIVRELDSSEGLGGCIADTDVRVMVVLYIASKQAMEQIQRALENVSFEKGLVSLHVVFELDHATRLDPEDDAELFRLLENEQYFDDRVDDEHAEVGGTSMRFGFADGRLPLVLSHNTPNNSIYVLWAEDGHDVRGLFPRVSRHRQLD